MLKPIKVYFVELFQFCNKKCFSVLESTVPFLMNRVRRLCSVCQGHLY